MQPPPLIGNKGEVGEFVLPLAVPGKEGESKFDDDTFAAVCPIHCVKQPPGVGA